LTVLSCQFSVRNEELRVAAVSEVSSGVDFAIREQRLKHQLKHGKGKDARGRRGEREKRV
jgi:hypothetical protein